MDLPNGFDRADGLEGRLGTPTPSGSISAASPDGSGGVAEVGRIEEAPESPSIERAEQATIQQTLLMPWAEALNRIVFEGRGKVVQDSFGNIYKVLSARIEHRPGDMANLIRVLEALSFDSPPDEFEIVPVELGLNIIKHPRYFYAFLGDGYGSATEQRNQMTIRLLQDYMANPSYNFRQSVIKLLKDSIGTEAGAGAQQPPKFNGGTGTFSAGVKVAGTDMAKRAALEIAYKFWRGEETPYIVGFQITWSSFYFVQQPLNPGGYVEDPILDATPQLPEYFFSTAFPPNFTNTIFDAITWYNPQCYATNGQSGGPLFISWLRKSDVQLYQRTWFKHTRTWIGAPVGYWDTELYTQNERPTSPEDYLLIKTDAS
jgi:hypothetical protein